MENLLKQNDPMLRKREQEKILLKQFVHLDGETVGRNAAKIRGRTGLDHEGCGMA
eukprot:gene16079-680_t